MESEKPLRKCSPNGRVAISNSHLWLQESEGIEVHEFGQEGCGWDHPKFHPSVRPRAAPLLSLLNRDGWLGRSFKANGEHWVVVGRSLEFPEQAEIMNQITGEVRTVSEDVLARRIGS